LDYPGFVHTVLVDMRARLARLARTDRIFQAVLDVAGQAGLMGRRRVLDSTPIYDAAATMDTITLLRSTIRVLLAAVAIPARGPDSRCRPCWRTARWSPSWTRPRGCWPPCWARI
jgi:hypothetical protein